MASITVRDIEDDMNIRLRIRAAENGRSVEEEVRSILRTALNSQPATRQNLASAIRARIAPMGGVELELPPRPPMREPVRFD